MALVQRFEVLVAWQRARALNREIYKVSNQGSFGKDFGLRSQIRDAAVSVMSNIAEGFERGSRKEFRQFLVIARASCSEVRSHLYAALDAGHLAQETFEYLCDQSLEVSRIISGSRTSLHKPHHP